MRSLHFSKLPLLLAGMLLCSGVQASQKFSVGDTFTCTFLNQGETAGENTSTATWTQDQIDSALRALSTWDSLIANTPGRTMTVALVWYDKNDSTLANASSPYSYYEISGPQQVSTVAEKVWRDGQTYSSGAYDVYINCNMKWGSSFYFGAEVPSSTTTGLYDFQSILTHELGHAVGFSSLATPTGSFNVQTGTTSGGKEYSTMLYTAYDCLMTNQAGEKLVELAANGTAFTLGETITLEGTGEKVYNPTDWAQGSSISHIDAASDPDALMQYAITPDTYRHTLSEKEMQVMKALGWDMVPEPSSAMLSLFAMTIFTCRRRRKSQTCDRC